MHSDLERIRAIIREATDGMSPADMSVHPEGKWSTANILEHLEKAFSTTATVLSRCVDDGAPRLKPHGWAERFGAWLVVSVGYFPTGRPAPDFVKPEGRAADESLEAIGRSLAALDAACDAAERRFGSRVKVANHPILGQFSVRQWRRFHLVHTRHHAKQIERLKQGLTAR